MGRRDARVSGRDKHHAWGCDETDHTPHAIGSRLQEKEEQFDLAVTREMLDESNGIWKDGLLTTACQWVWNQVRPVVKTLGNYPLPRPEP